MGKFSIFQSQSLCSSDANRAVTAVGGYGNVPLVCTTRPIGLAVRPVLQHKLGSY